MSDEALALAALEAGHVPYRTWQGLWGVERCIGLPADTGWNGPYKTPLAALAAAARALGLKPKWVVVDRETAEKAAPLLNSLAKSLEALEGWAGSLEHIGQLEVGALNKYCDEIQTLMTLSSALSPATEGGEIGEHPPTT